LGDNSRCFNVDFDKLRATQACYYSVCFKGVPWIWIGSYVKCVDDN